MVPGYVTRLPSDVTAISNVLTQNYTYSSVVLMSFFYGISHKENEPHMRDDRKYSLVVLRHQTLTLRARVGCPSSYLRSFHILCWSSIELIPTASEKRGVVEVGSIHVAILPSCQDLKNYCIMIT